MSGKLVSVRTGDLISDPRLFSTRGKVRVRQTSGSVFHLSGVFQVSGSVFLPSGGVSVQSGGYSPTPWILSTTHATAAIGHRTPRLRPDFSEADKALAVRMTWMRLMGLSATEIQEACEGAGRPVSLK